MAKICSWVVQFLKIGTPKDPVRLSKYLTKVKFNVKYITKSISELPRAASDSKRKFFQLLHHNCIQYFYSIIHMGGRVCLLEYYYYMNTLSSFSWASLLK